MSDVRWSERVMILYAKVWKNLNAHWTLHTAHTTYIYELKSVVHWKLLSMRWPHIVYFVCCILHLNHQSISLHFAFSSVNYEFIVLFSNNANIAFDIFFTKSLHFFQKKFFYDFWAKRNQSKKIRRLFVTFRFVYCIIIIFLQHRFRFSSSLSLSFSSPFDSFNRKCKAIITV